MQKDIINNLKIKELYKSQRGFLAPNTMKILLVVGHTGASDKGAYSPTLKKSEFDYNLELANEVKAHNEQMFDVYIHTERDYYKRQTALANYANKKNYNLVIELHFNSFNETSNGFECLYYASSVKGKQVAEKLSYLVANKYKSRLRGNNGAVPIATKSERGYWFLVKMKAIAIVYEPFFGSNPEESQKFADVKKHAEILYNSLLCL